jgi:polyisoprenoid-binding protein YceI
VITGHEVAGTVWLASVLDRSTFELHIPVASLVVDDDAARRSAGGDFPADVPQADKDATRRNMLGPDVLDAEHHGEVRVESVSIQTRADRTLARVAVVIRDATRVIDVPIDFVAATGSLRVRGAVSLHQSEFGIEPFSVALGALRVEDEIRIRFDLLARPAPPS